MKDSKEIMEQLQAPFPPENIEWRVGSTNKDKTKGLALAYVTNRAIQNRLDDVFGCYGWQNSFKEWKGTSQICGISVFSEYHNAWITKWDGSDDSATEAVKGGLSDSMKRAAYQWGIGRYLYNLPQTWVALKDGKYLAETPKLPQWALPKDYKTPASLPVDMEPNTATSTQGNTNSQPSSKLSDKQVNRAIAIGKSKGITLAQIKQGILKDYKKSEIAELTKTEYEELCTRLENAQKGA